MPKKALKPADSHLRSSMGQEILVQDVMTRGVLTVQKYDTIVNVAHILTERNISGLPVVDRDYKLLGIITQADVLSMLGMGKAHTVKDLLKYMLGERLPERRIGDTVGDIMTGKPQTIRPDMNVSKAVEIMDDKKIRRLPVVDEKGKLIGILTRADILRAVIKKLK
ncbi:MAG: CBS domain-containing protein [Nitrospirota bacterium]|nr:CBS domain-containing protein [Nitrospirota bacterium]